MPPALTLALLGSVLASAVDPPVVPRTEGSRDSAVATESRFDDRPVDFIANDGQWQDGSSFGVVHGALGARIAPDRITVGAADGASVGFVFEGASDAAVALGENARTTRYNFVEGDDRHGWREGVASYESVRLEGVHVGIDVRVRAEGGDLAYDVLAAPGADASQVVVRLDGATGLRLGPAGELIADTPNGPLVQTAPVAWEVDGGDEVPVAAIFVILGAERFGFDVERVDPTRSLVIDPGITWSSFLGGSGDEALGGIARVADGTGDLIVAGWTRSPEFPAAGGLRASGSVFVARMAATGSNLVYATYFGGSNVHTVYDVAVDTAGNPLVVGDTNSKDFPLTPGAVDSSPPGNPASPLDFGDYDGYVIRFNASGGGPLLATYLSGAPVSGIEVVSRAGYDPSGNPVVAGHTNSPSFPTTTGAFDRTLGGSDAFVTRLSPDGTQLLYSTFLGGDGTEEVYELAVGGDGLVNLTGQTIVNTTTGLFPRTSGAFDSTAGASGDREAFYVRLATGNQGAADLRYSTLLGGNYVEAGNGLAISPGNPASVTISGFTRSGDFPTTAGAYQRVHPVPIDGSVGWVARFDAPSGGAPGATVQWSTLYGSSGNQNANDVVVDGSGAAIIVGGTAVNNPPTTPGAFDRIPAAGSGDGDRADAYVAKLSADGSQLVYSSLLGARAGETALEVVHAGGNEVVVAGITNSTDFPTTVGVYDRTYASDGRPSGNDDLGTLAEDIFLSRVSLDPVTTGDTTAPPAPTIQWPAEGTVFTQSDSTGVRVAFDWSDVTDASGVAAYHVQVSPNAEFRNDFQAELDGWYEPWSPTSFDSYFYCCSSTMNRTYSMRVQALDSSGNIGPWSAVHTFRVVGTTGGGGSSSLTAPVLTSPPSGGRYRPGSFTFAWEHVSGAAAYTIEVDRSSTFTTTSRQTRSGLTTNRATLTLSGERTWFWRVRATAGSTLGPWSATRSFSTRNGSPTPPVPAPGTPIPPPPTSGGTGLRSLLVNPEIAGAGASLTGTVTLHEPAPTGGAVVALANTYPARVVVPASVTVPAGATTATFNGSTIDGPHAVTATVIGTYGGASHAWYVQTLPATPTLVLNSLALSTGSTQGGSTVTGTVAFLPGWLAGPGGAIVHLGSTNPNVASVPASVVIPQGSSSATFSIATSAVASQTPVTIIATRSSMKATVLDVLPVGGLSSVSASPNPAVGTGGSTGTVTLGGPAPSGGTVVSLSSSDTRWATVPASVTVAGGSTTATFPIGTNSDPTQGRFSIITASAGGIQRSVSLNVNPPPPGPTLSSASVSPSSVTGGSGSSGTVTLSGTVSACCAVVNLASSNAAAVVPASVTVPVGSSSTTFPITTSMVTAITSVTITASRGGINRTATLTVNPAGG